VPLPYAQHVQNGDTRRFEGDRQRLQMGQKTLGRHLGDIRELSAGLQELRARGDAGAGAGEGDEDESGGVDADGGGGAAEGALPQIAFDEDLTSRSSDAGGRGGILSDMAQLPRFLGACAGPATFMEV
jgi:hypothetical protein